MLRWPCCWPGYAKEKYGRIMNFLFLARKKFERYYWARRCIQGMSHTGLGTTLCRGQKWFIDVLRYHVEVCPDLESAPAQVAETICSERCRISLPAMPPSSWLATQPAKRAGSAWTARLGTISHQSRPERLILTPEVGLDSSRRQAVLVASTSAAGAAVGTQFSKS